VQKFLETLNHPQQQATTTVKGPMMIIAGAGSGKTRVITFRIAYLMHNGVDPFSILALTFTNKAAKEMKERIEQIVGADKARSLWMGTFHSVFNKILRIESEKLGFPANFTVYDTDDSKSLLKSIIKELGLDEKQYKPNLVYSRISAAKNNLLSWKAYNANEEIQREDKLSVKPQLGTIYKIYQQRLFQSSAMDFDDLLFNTNVLFRDFPDVLLKYQHKFKYVMVDEYQDTNFSQYVIVKKLAAVNENICVVGDDAQSIYAFRGANIQNILNFKKDYPDLKVFKLEQNYRSTKIIVKAANSIIANNKAQLKKDVWTQNDEGEKIDVLRAFTDNEEGQIVASSIFETKMNETAQNSAFAILYRTNAQSRAFEEGLRKLNIPYRIYGGISFYQRKEVKDLVAYLKLTINPNDEESFKRIINYPARGIGKTSIEKLMVYASDNDKSLWTMSENIDLLQFNAGTRKLFADFVTMIKSFQTLLNKKDAYEVASHIAKSTGILKELYNDQSVEGLSRYENIQELLNSIKEFVSPEAADSPEYVAPLPDDMLEEKTLALYLQQVTLLTDADAEGNEDETVKLMTIHAAKGLEFKSVFVVGLEENLFPGTLSVSSREDLEEERRLFYVAVTRAEQKLTITHAATRYKYGNLEYCEPSRFLEELPQNLLQYVGYNSKSWTEDKSNKKQYESGTSVTKVKPVAPVSNYIHKPSTDFVAAFPEELQSGMDVEHQKFGFGKILAMEGSNDGKMATIFFQQAGQKKLLLKFAKLSIVKSN